MRKKQARRCREGGAALARRESEAEGAAALTSARQARELAELRELVWLARLALRRRTIKLSNGTIKPSYGTIKPSNGTIKPSPLNYAY